MPGSEPNALRTVLTRMAIDAQFAEQIRRDPTDLVTRYGLTAEEAAIVRGAKIDTAVTRPGRLGERLSRSVIFPGIDVLATADLDVAMAAPAEPAATPSVPMWGAVAQSASADLDESLPSDVTHSLHAAKAPPGESDLPVGSDSGATTAVNHPKPSIPTTPDTSAPAESHLDTILAKQAAWLKSTERVRGPFPNL